MQLKPISQQVVVVVGASSGIGRETALKFAQRGAKVVVSARSQSGLDSLVDEIRSFTGEATAIVADVSDFNQVKAIADKAVEQYGRIDTCTAFEGQRTNEPKASDAPDNLFEPLPGYNTVQGDFSAQAKSSSF